MPLFDYKALQTDGKHKRGIVESDTVKTARQKLKKQGLMVVEITEKTKDRAGNTRSVPFVGNRVGVKDIAMITRQLASLIKANIPLVEALDALVAQMEKVHIRVMLDDVKRAVNEGASLAKAMAAHPRLFDNIYINMVEAGESSGTLSLVLLRLADLKEAQVRLRAKVVSGMTYPAIMMAISVVLLILIFAFVIPKLTQVFESMNKPIPMTTKILISASGIVVNYWPLLIIGAFVGFILLQSYIRSPTGRPKWDKIKLTFPIFGPIVRSVAITRFANTMGTLLASGVPILTSMAIARNLVGNLWIERAIDQARENITEGQSIAEPLKRSGEFPPVVIHMIAIGEKTGELPEMLSNVAENFEEQVNGRIETMTSLIEPAMIVMMGGLVAFIVLAIFIPLLEISNISR